jgi:nitrite reductase/ring-hydroxylating ferredoxin subunit/uncharacterized membrane protein
MARQRGGLMDGQSVVYAANTWERLVGRVEQAGSLDGVADRVHELVTRAIRNGALKDALSGTWLGHPAHPMFTDLPIGFWTSAFVLDFIGGRRARDASELLVGLGVLSALPTAATGAADWSDTWGASRRVGFVHAAANSSAVLLYAWSWSARRRNRHARGVALGVLGATAATIGGFLGGHLLSRRGVGVDHAAHDPALSDWMPAISVDAVSSAPTRVEVDDVPIIVIERDERILAVAATCPHRGAPLDEGTFDDTSVTCPWHGSRFALDTGALLRGPSAMPLACFETRVTNGTVEIRTPVR